MYCQDLQACFNEISAYCNSVPLGKALLINTESYNVFQAIRAKMETDSNKQCVYVSQCCPEVGMPQLDDILTAVTEPGCQVLVGFSQTAMLRSAEYVDKLISVLLELPIRDYAIILLDHCEQYLTKHFSVHPDIKKRVVLMTGQTSVLPRIRLATSAEECIGGKPLPSMKRLFRWLEDINDETIRRNQEIDVITSLSPSIFATAVYSVSSVDSIYTGLRKQYPDIASSTNESYGTDAQWHYLAGLMSKYHSLSASTEAVFGSTIGLASHINEVLDEDNLNKYWYLWLSMKVFGAKGNLYLTTVLQNSTAVSNFEEHAYMDLLGIKYDSPEFRQCYVERKRLLNEFPDNITMIDLYLSKVGIHESKSVYYITDETDKEKLAFMQCLGSYSYSEDDLQKITEFTFPELHRYLQRFTFNITNTKLPSYASSLWNDLTTYFQSYKIQKITNRIFDEHMAAVEEYASSRPYTKLQARSAVIGKIDRTNSQLYFFDALGVEYLAYIAEKCECYGMTAEIAVAQCELPSITANNKDFLHFFSNSSRDIKELDELKHHSQVIDYEQCKYPVHLFLELEIIDSELRKIQSCLMRGEFDKAVIVSDHGASRLAVIHEQESPKLELSEKGEHSGRCCPANADPKIPYAFYNGEYSILANYDRFRGSRKANVEVHGGATLEEVLVPVIVLAKKPTDIEICFVDSNIKLKGKEPATIVVFSNAPMHEPKLLVNEVFYNGTFEADSRHAKFVMPELKRTKNWTADFYDGDIKIASSMEFHVQKGDTQEREFFNKTKLTL